MLKKLDELEEHPTFYERSEEDVLVAPEGKAKSSDNFEEVDIAFKNISFLLNYCSCSKLTSYYFLLNKKSKETQKKYMYLFYYNLKTQKAKVYLHQLIYAIVIKLICSIYYQTCSQISTLTKVWIYFLPRFRASLLENPMYSSYSNEGSHGLKYCEKYARDPSYNHRNEVQ